MGTPRSYRDDVRWIPCRNVGAYDIPGFSLIRVVDVDGDGTHQVAAPNVESDPCLFFSQEATILKGARGNCTKDFPWWVSYAPADGTPLTGQSWGSIAGTGANAADWQLHRASSGFRIGGGANGRIVEAGCSCS